MTMLERDLPLGEAKGLSFVEHWYCRETRTCAEKSLAMRTAAAQTLAFLLGNNIHCVDHLLLDKDALNSGAESHIMNLWGL